MSLSTDTLQVLDFYPSRGFFRPGEEITLQLEVACPAPADLHFTLRIFRGPALFTSIHSSRRMDAGRSLLEFTCSVPSGSPAGYGADLTLDFPDGKSATLTTAFDVLADWTRFPRYGFVCNFSAGRPDPDQTVQSLSRYHINGLQFYDWQYRHDDLLPPTDDYLDPLNRPQSLNSTRRLIAAAHARGMAAMPYLAVYAASADFWLSHPQWMLYDADHKPIPFGENFLGIMNPVDGGPWQRHLLEECRKVLDALPFNGLHIDQYGEPKTGEDADGRPVDIASAFGDFVRAVAAQHPGLPVLFNAVGNWPIDTLAASPTTFNYIEIWPPDVAYTDVARIVRNARELSEQKPVVIALYIPASRAVNNCLADALIYSTGGSRIELGEDCRLLSDPYFPKHEALSPALAGWLRRAADLMVRYEEWFSPLVPESVPGELSVPDGVAAFFRESTVGASLSLVNLTGPEPLAWNAEHVDPPVVIDFEVNLTLGFAPRAIWLVSPDRLDQTPVDLPFTRQGERLQMLIPELKIWDVIIFER
jgi:dextranase